MRSGFYAAATVDESLKLRLCVVWMAALLFQIQPERHGFRREITASDLFDCRDHAAIASEQLICQRDDARVRRRCCRSAAQRQRDARLVARGIERAYSGIGARRRAADAHKAVHDQRGTPVPAADEI